MAEEKPKNQENYRIEYKEVATSHRFYVGLRFVIAAFTATLQSALLKLYSDALQATSPPEVLLFGYRFSLGGHPVSIAAVGCITMLAILVMERRNIDRFKVMLKRGKEVEFNLLLLGGQFSRLGETTGLGLFTYTWSLGVIYTGIGAMWLWLLFFNLVALYERNFK